MPSGCDQVIARGASPTRNGERRSICTGTRCTKCLCFSLTLTISGGRLLWKTRKACHSYRSRPSICCFTSAPMPSSVMAEPVLAMRHCLSHSVAPYPSASFVALVICTSAAAASVRHECYEVIEGKAPEMTMLCCSVRPSRRQHLKNHGGGSFPDEATSVACHVNGPGCFWRNVLIRGLAGGAPDLSPNSALLTVGDTDCSRCPTPIPRSCWFGTP